MRFDLNDLPSEPALLQHLLRDMAVAVEHRDGEIERLKSIIKTLQRAQFGRRSERLDPDQLALALEEIDSDLAREEEKRRPGEKQAGERSSRRKPLPDHLQREDVRIDIENTICSCCGGALHVIGESVSEMLDWVPAELRVIRTTRPKYACRTCEMVAQAPAAERPIAGGLATPALLAQVLVSKYCDPTPLYRQAQIFARHGIDLPRSTLAGWVGEACWWLEALHDRLARNVFASDHLFADDTPMPVLDPGRGRTKTGRLWVYAREQRAWGGPEPPAAVYLYAPDRKAERQASHLERFSGVLHVDGYAGFEPLTERGDVVLAACWSHTRRKFYDVRRPRTRRLPSRRCAGSANSTLWKRTLTVSRLPSGLRFVALAPSQSSRPCTNGSRRSFHCCRDEARLPRRSGTRWRAGRVSSASCTMAASNWTQTPSSARSDRLLSEGRIISLPAATAAAGVGPCSVRLSKPASSTASNPMPI